MCANKEACRQFKCYFLIWTCNKQVHTSWGGVGVGRETTRAWQSKKAKWHQHIFKCLSIFATNPRTNICVDSAPTLPHTPPRATHLVPASAAGPPPREYVSDTFNKANKLKRRSPSHNYTKTILLSCHGKVVGICAKIQNLNVKIPTATLVWWRIQPHQNIVVQYYYYFFRNIHFLCVVLYMFYKLLCRLVKLYLLWWEFSTLLTPPITLLHQNGGIPTVWSPSQSHVVAFTADKCACPAPWRCCKSAVSPQGRWLSTAAQPRHERTRVLLAAPPPPFFFIFKPLPVLSRRFLSRCAISFCLFASLKQTLTNLDLKLALGHKQNKTWQHMMSVKRIVTAFASFIHYSTEVMWLTWWTDMKVISER